MEEHWEPYPQPRSNYRAEEDEYTFSSHYNPNDSELLNIEDDLYNESSSYYLPLYTVNLLQTFERCNPQVLLGDTNKSRQISISKDQDIRFFDDAEGFLNMKKNFILKSVNGKSYRILCHLGKGTFGEAFICRSIETGDFFAVKVTRSLPEYAQQGRSERTMLFWICNADPSDEYHLIRLSDYQFLRNHHCYISPLYSFTLLDLMHNNIQGLSFVYIRFIAVSLLRALSFLHRNQVIHTDIKPENILFEGSGKSLTDYKIRLIDMGSCVNSNPVPSHYCQSCFYRAPEVFLRLPFSPMIDIWSLGVVLCECFLSSTLLYGRTDHEMLYLISRQIGSFPSTMVRDSPVKKQFFTENNKVQINQAIADYENSHPLLNYRKAIEVKPMKLRMNEEEKEQYLHDRSQFIHLISYMLELDPHNRHSADMLLQHPFITKSRYSYNPLKVIPSTPTNGPRLPTSGYYASNVHRMPYPDIVARQSQAAHYSNQPTSTAFSHASSQGRMSRKQPTFFSTQNVRNSNRSTTTPSYMNTAYSQHGRRGRQKHVNSQLDQYIQFQKHT